MNKTLTINLGGIVFHIDEDAYLVLNEYLNSLKKYFGDGEGSAEIRADIESRIAEILAGKRTETSQVITLAEVNEVIAIMGKPVDIDPDGNPETDGEDPGAGKGAKRFFRDPGEKIIAGVCSGIAAYFHLDPVWIRLIFIVFLAAGGSGILLYLVLWIVIPEAKTTSDRLEMHGKKITVPNLQRSMREEVSELGHRLGAMANGSAETLRRAGSGSRSFFETMGRGLVWCLQIAWKVIVLLTGILLILTGLGLLIAIVAYTLGWTGVLPADHDVSMLAFPDFARILVGCTMPVSYLQAVLLLVLGIPSFMLIYNGARMVFRFERVRHLGLTLFNIWILGLFFTVWSGFRIYHLYQYKEEKQISLPLENPRCDTLTITCFPGDPAMKYIGEEQFFLMDNWKTVIAPEGELYVVPDIRIEPSADSLFSITQVTIARGKTRLQARQHLSGIRFQSATSGNELRISPFLRIPGEKCWNGQVIDIIVRVPRGKFIRMNPDMKHFKPWWGWLLQEQDATVLQMKEDELVACHDSISRTL